MTNYIAYIDESGDPIFAEGASKTLVLCAVVLEKEGLPLLSEALARIRAAYNMSVIKSSRVRSFNQRYTICQHLISSAPKIITLRVDKDALFGDWFACNHPLK